ncbi:hypothetical protein DYBT9275_02756 [Dyadobacter sp. CECT 9275]|uniref:Phage terminase large subunit n=1 Tax=Dyadobacter helix TaxID=2822344 RepID=A0A916JCC4_9BACT|nr:hypothetical protein [Dyadobacter sp. CECT 9275]CAG5001862.1 hypothetical protein DYBT9275_02756 [Dyadobacter sp. CECT 9275]
MQLLEKPKVNFILYGGAIRGAKTIWLAITFAYLAIFYPNSRWAIMRADRPKIKNNLLPSVNFVYSQREISQHIVDRNRQDLTYTFENGSVIQLFAESYTQDKDMTRFHGLEVNGFGCDELPEFQEQTLDKCFERAGSWLNAGYGANGKKPRPLVLGSANPTKNWVKTRIYDKWKDGCLPEGWEYVQAKVSDNPYVPESYKLSLKANMTTINYQRFVDGDWEWVESNGHEWLHEFNYTQHVRKVAYMPGLPTYLTFDFNVLPYMTMLCFQVEEIAGGYRVRFYDEFCLEHPRNTAEDVCKAWIQKYPKVYGSAPVSYCGDASGENRIPGFGERKAFNPVRETLKPFLHSSSNRVYKKQFFNEFLRKFLNDILSGHLPVEVWIDETNCPKLIKDIQETLESQSGGFTKEKVVQEKTGLKYEKNGHCVDAFKYGLLSVFSKTYEEKYHKVQY